MNTEKASYTIRAITDGVMFFDDYSDASFYLIEGKNKAVVIDTGMGEGNVKQLAAAFLSDPEKPIELAVTHYHGDHMMHADQFDVIYLHQADIDLLHTVYDKQIGADAVEDLLRRIRPLHENDIIDLGDNKLRVLEAAGHTPGSVVFVDEAHKLLFFGDAIGSGVGVWMQLNHCCTTSAYKRNLEHLRARLVPFEDYLCLGGHYGQQGTVGTPGYNPLCIALLDDLITLCGLLLQGKVKGEFYSNDFGEEQVLIAKHGRAAIVYKPSLVR